MTDASPKVEAPILTIEGLHVILPEGGDRSHAVQDVGFELRRGEILCVVGESGSGKSVLSSAVMGALPTGLSQAAGLICLRGQDLGALSDAELRKIRGNRIAMIPQEPMAALNPVVPVGKQIEEVFKLHAALTAKERRTRALALLASMHFPDPERIADSYPHQLSGGQCQRAVIAMALAMNPDVLIADEPTTALDVTTQAQILKLICELREAHGHGVLFITHDFGVVAQIADRIAVMRGGCLVEIGDADQVLKAPAHPYTRELIAAVPSLTPRRAAPASRNPLSLTVIGLAKSYGGFRALDGVDIELRRGETLSIVGESGSGKSTLAKLLVRLVEPTAGVVRAGGADFLKLQGKVLRKQRSAIQMIFQDPFGSLNPRRTVGEVITRAGVLSGSSRAEARRRAIELLELVGLSPEAFNRKPRAFSGGQRQRIGIARALAMKPEILIADESVSALDVSVQTQVLNLLTELQAKLGLALLFITHDLRVAAQLGGRVAVLHKGKVVEHGDACDVLVNPQHDYTKLLVNAVPGRGVI